MQNEKLSALTKFELNGNELVNSHINIFLLHTFGKIGCASATFHKFEAKYGIALQHGQRLKVFYSQSTVIHNSIDVRTGGEES